MAANAVLFSHAPATLTIVAIVGTATALVAATIGLVQNDIKRVLAYSTVSQLGYMFLAMRRRCVRRRHLPSLTHAFFKALLFLGSGAVIHALAGEQDMRKMGGLKKDLPITYWTFVIGAIAIAGIPPFAGFFSKDEILFRTYISGHMLLWVVGILTAMLTATYMFRLVFMTFHGPSPAASAPQVASGAHASVADPSDHSDHRGHLHDAPPAMAVALIVLAFGSVVAGWAGIGGRFEHFLEPSFGPAIGVAGEAAEGGPETALMILSVIVAIAGIGIAAYFFLKNRQAADRVADQFSGVHRLLSNKYYVDEVYDAAVVQPIHIISEDGLWKGVDVGVIDRTVNGVAHAVGGGGEVLRRLQTGSVRAYAASVFLGVVLILGYYLWP